jgi:hypothetical protein
MQHTWIICLREFTVESCSTTQLSLQKDALVLGNCLRDRSYGQKVQIALQGWRQIADAFSLTVLLTTHAGMPFWASEYPKTVVVTKPSSTFSVSLNPHSYPTLLDSGGPRLGSSHRWHYEPVRAYSHCVEFIPTRFTVLYKKGCY